MRACPRCLGLRPVNARVSAVLFIIRALIRVYENPSRTANTTVNPVNNMSLEILLLAAEYVDRRGRQYNTVCVCIYEICGLYI